MPGTETSSPLHAMSIDVEDYFHVAALSGVIRPDQWDSLPSRVEQNTERLLSLFEKHDVKATFCAWMGCREVSRTHSQVV